jgi:ubiquinone/menaquinone biosynthesis C-methylase UbiE
LLATGPLPERVLDVGTGTARIPIEICARAPDVRVVAIDLADSMLAVAKENLERTGFAGRVELQRVDAKAMPYADGEFASVVSNSIVHHIPTPKAVLEEMWRVTAPGGLLFVRDLFRPASEADVARLVALYGGTPPANPARIPAFECGRDSFRASLRAALTVEEIAALAAPLGIPSDAVRATSDRHWTLAFRKP